MDLPGPGWQNAIRLLDTALCMRVGGSILVLFYFKKKKKLEHKPVPMRPYNTRLGPMPSSGMDGECPVPSHWQERLHL